MLSDSDSGPKHGARFHFELPGSLDGFLPEAAGREGGDLVLENVSGHSALGGRSLAVRYSIRKHGARLRASASTFFPDRAPRLDACPSLYPEQAAFAALSADAANRSDTTVRFYVMPYGGDDRPVVAYGPREKLRPGQSRGLDWAIPDTGGQPIAAIGLEVSADAPADGVVYLDFLGWHGEPSAELGRPRSGGSMWLSAWSGDVDYHEEAGDGIRLGRKSGRGLLVQGDAGWRDCRIVTTLTAVTDCVHGLAVRVRGPGDYYAFLLGSGLARLVRVLDGKETVLADVRYDSVPGRPRRFELKANGRYLAALIGGRQVFSLEDGETPLVSGGVGIVCEAGDVGTGGIEVRAS